MPSHCSADKSGKACTKAAPHHADVAGNFAVFVSLNTNQANSQIGRYGMGEGRAAFGRLRTNFVPREVSFDPTADIKPALPANPPKCTFVF
jgi:hypothetical protein